MLNLSERQLPEHLALNAPQCPCMAPSTCFPASPSALSAFNSMTHLYSLQCSSPSRSHPWLSAYPFSRSDLIYPWFQQPELVPKALHFPLRVPYRSPPATQAPALGPASKSTFSSLRTFPGCTQSQNPVTTWDSFHLSTHSIWISSISFKSILFFKALYL